MTHESCPSCGRPGSSLAICPECGEVIASTTCCYGGITGTDDNGFPVFCEECLVGLILSLDWLVQQMGIHGHALEYAPPDAIWLDATEGALQTLIIEHDRVLNLYEQQDGYNAQDNPTGIKVGGIPYWPNFRTLAGMGDK